MKKAYLLTLSTVFLFLSLITYLTYYSNWNHEVEGNIAKIKSLDKIPYIFDDVQYSMRQILQLHWKFESHKGTFTASFEDFIPAPTNITTLLQEYEDFLEGKYAEEYNVDLDLNQTELLSSPKILFTNGLVYEYGDTKKNVVFIHGGGPFTSAAALRIRANKKLNRTEANWSWVPSGDIYVVFDIKDSDGNVVYINGSTSGWVSASDENVAVIKFSEEGTVTPEITIQIGNVNGEIGSVQVERSGPVDYGLDTTINVTSYGPITAYLPATLNISDGTVFVYGRVNLEEM